MQSTSPLAQENVKRYYQASTEDYLRYYDTDWHGHMHYGFERDLPKGGNPTENLVRYLAHCAQFQPGMRIVDAGCGVGGSSRWLAKHKGCQCVGLNLMDTQAVLARRYAAREGVSGQAQYVCADFMRPPLKDSSVDGIWAIESSDHAPDKAEWIRTMAKLLKPGGCIAVADGFQAERPFDADETQRYQAFLAGWAVPHLATASAFRQAMEQNGLEVYEEDITADVMQHAFAIYRFSFLFIPWRRLLRKLGVCSAEKLGNAVATKHQYTTLQEGLWSYRIFVGRKKSSIY